MNNKKAYERKLNNFKDYEIGKLKEITAQFGLQKRKS